MRNVLYLTYDGLSDPLGRSQIVPYLTRLGRRGHQITIVSAEKPAGLAQSEQRIRLLLSEAGIQWHPVTYAATPKGLAALITICRLYAAAQRLCSASSFHIVHCRSYLPALIGLYLKRRYKLKMIFDMRGFWADERMEGGIWSRHHFAYRLVYRYFKHKENDMLKAADAVITLTHRAKEIMTSWQLPGLKAERICVIPCVTDTQHFAPRSNEQQVGEIKIRLGINSGERVLVYCGSLGTWYMMNEMLLFFQRLVLYQPNWKFLLITQSEKEIIFRQATAVGVDTERLVVVAADYDEVPALLEVADLAIFFITPVFSKQASSPTKLAEYLSMGIPVIGNDIGDVAFYLNRCGAGMMPAALTVQGFDEMVPRVDELLALNRKQIRHCAAELLDLRAATDCYHQLYESL